MNVRDEARAFLDLALAEPGIMVADGVPPNMRAGEVNPDGWVPWRPVRSEVSDAELDALESALGVRLPPIYRAILLDRHFIELHAGVVELDEHPSGHWRESIRERVRIYGIPDEPRLFPIGREPMSDAGTLYFDLRVAAPDGDAPVVCHDLGWIGTDEEWRTLFSSGRCMLAALSELLRRPVEHDPWRSRAGGEEHARERAECLAAFFAADPLGAGGVGRSWFEGMARARAR